MDADETTAIEPHPVTVSKIPVRRTARYAMTGADPSQTRALWIVFHGYGQRAADFIGPFAQAAPNDARVVAPEGLSRFYLELPRADGGHLSRTGATWLTRDDREDELRDALGMLFDVVEREFNRITDAAGEPPSLHILGFSQGVAMSMRWAIDRLTREGPASRVPIATHALWAGGLPHDVAAAALREAWRGTAVRLITGEHDRLVSEAALDGARTQLTEVAVGITEHRFGGGHRLDTPLLRSLMILAQHAGASRPER